MFRIGLKHIMVPNNAVLALAGDIDLETAKEKVSKFFGDIPSWTSSCKT